MEHGARPVRSGPTARLAPNDWDKPKTTLLLPQEPLNPRHIRRTSGQRSRVLAFDAGRLLPTHVAGLPLHSKYLAGSGDPESGGGTLVCLKLWQPLQPLQLHLG